MSPDFYEGAFCGACVASAVWLTVAFVRRVARLLAEADWEMACLAAR